VFVTGQSFFFLQFRSIIEFLRLFNFFTIFFYSVLIVFIFGNIEWTSHIRFKHLITTKEYRINNSMKKIILINHFYYLLLSAYCSRCYWQTNDVQWWWLYELFPFFSPFFFSTKFFFKFH